MFFISNVTVQVPFVLFFTFIRPVPSLVVMDTIKGGLSFVDIIPHGGKSIDLGVVR